MKTARKRTTARHATENHRLLGVAVDADLETIKKAYRHLALEVHPDTNPGDPGAADRFRQLTEAYDALAATAPEPPPSERASASTEPDQPHGPSSYFARNANSGPTRAGWSSANSYDIHEEARAHRPWGGRNIFADDSQEPAASEQAPGSTHSHAEHATHAETDRTADRATDAATEDAVGHKQRTRHTGPVELPATLANYLTRAALLGPILWAIAGFPWVLGRTSDEISPAHLVLCGLAAVVGWLALGVLLWSRAPSIQRQPPGWRSPGWDGTALLVRLVMFHVLALGSSSMFLFPYLDADSEDRVAWHPVLWALLLIAAWVISGQFPRRMGYRSRYDRFWRLAHNGLPPRVTRRPRPPRPRATPPPRGR